MEGYVPLPLTSLYVGDLSPEVTEEDILETFSQAGPLVSVRLCLHKLTKKSLCYGYVNFLFPCHAYVALNNLNHSMLKGRSMRIMYSQRDPILRKNGVGNLFVKNLDQSVTSAQLQEIFSKYGAIISSKIAEDNGKSKGFGFVQFKSEVSAMKAINALHGTDLGSKKLYVANFMTKNQRTAKTDSGLKGLFVRNLDKTLTENHLRDKFSKYGKIHSVFVMKDEKGKSKGFGFVNFESHDSAAKAIEDPSGVFLGSRRVSLYWALTKDEREVLNRAIGIKASNLHNKSLDTSVVGTVNFSSSDELMKSVDTYRGSDFHGRTVFGDKSQWKEWETIKSHKPYTKSSVRQVFNINNQQPHYNFFPQQCASLHIKDMIPDWPDLSQGFIPSATLQAEKFNGSAFYSQPMRFCASYSFRKGNRYSGPSKYRNPRDAFQNMVVEGGYAKGCFTKHGYARRPHVRNLQPRFAAIGYESTQKSQVC